MNKVNWYEGGTAPLTHDERFAAEFEDYATAILARLAKGHVQYGDKSYERSINELAGEIQQELLDVAGWAFIMYRKLERLKL